MGGVGLDKSLLTTYLGIFTYSDDIYTLEDELYLKTKPNDGAYVCSAEALGVNKIDLVEHEKTAITYSKAGALLRDFLIKHSTKGVLIPIGHGVKGDLEFIERKLLKTLYHYISYRALDTGTISQFLKTCGLLENDNRSGLSYLANKVGIEVPTDIHDAKVDTELTVELLEKYIEIVKAPK